MPKNTRVAIAVGFAIAVLGVLTFVVALGTTSGQRDKPSTTTTTSVVPVSTTTPASTTMPNAPTTSTSTSTPPTTTTSDASVLTKWCGLSLGDSRQLVESVLGKGIEVTRKELSDSGPWTATWTAERWMNQDGFLLLVTWDETGARALQAYPSRSGTVLPCQQFRNVP